MSWDPRGSSVDRDRWDDEPDAAPRGGYPGSNPEGDEARGGYRDDYPDERAEGRPRRRVAEPQRRNALPRITLGVAVVGSIIFVIAAVLARDIPLLVSATTIFGIVFIAVAVAGGRATWRAATDGRSGRALGIGVGGGVAAIIGLAALAMAVVLVLIWGR